MARGGLGERSTVGAAQLFLGQLAIDRQLGLGEPPLVSLPTGYIPDVVPRGEGSPTMSRLHYFFLCGCQAINPNREYFETARGMIRPLPFETCRSWRIGQRSNLMKVNQVASGSERQRSPNPRKEPAVVRQLADLSGECPPSPTTMNTALKNLGKFLSGPNPTPGFGPY
jgi:hypothetical protein